jgi:uncharacterized membrane protein HdeD (DUF308 family)
MPADTASLRPLARSWWVVALLGAINVIAGVLAIAHPGFTLQVVGIVLGIYLVLAALAAILAGVSGSAESRSLSLILGLVGMIAGLVFLRRPGDSLLALVVVAGIYLTAVGVIRVADALVRPGPRAVGVALGALDVIVGILLLALPDVTLGTLAVLVGISMLLHGLFDLVAALALRRLRDTAPADPTRPAGAGFAT